MDPVEEKLAAYVSKLARRISRLRVRYYTVHVKVGGIWVDRPVPESVHIKHDKMFSYYIELSDKLDVIRKGNRPKVRKAVTKATLRTRTKPRAKKIVMGNVFDM